MSNLTPDFTKLWEESYEEMAALHVGEDSKKEFMELTSCKWDDVSESVDLATKAFAFDGFNPIRTGKLIAERAPESKNIAALVVLALEVGSLNNSGDIRVMSKDVARKLISAFGIVGSAKGNSNAITLPRVVLCFPSYAFNILLKGKVEPKVTTTSWPACLSFSGSINALHPDMRKYLSQAYTVWSTVFGLTISQGSGYQKSKNVVKQLAAVLAGEEIDHSTWSRNSGFTDASTRIIVVGKQESIKNTLNLREFVDDLATCVVAARGMRVPSVGSGKLLSEEVEKVITDLNSIISRLEKEIRNRG